MGKYKNAGYALLGLSIVIWLTGCAVGPDFQQPAGPGVDAYTSKPIKAAMDPTPKSPGDAQKIVEGKRAEVEWWHELGSTKLDVLIKEGLERNPTLKEAEATLRQSQELFAAKSASTYYPQVEGSLGGQRQRINPGALGQSGQAIEFSLYNADVGVRYVLDLAGGNRRALEALAARSDFRRFQLEGARLTLAANIATTAIIQANLSRQIDALESILRSQEEQLKLIREQVRLGEAQPADIPAMQTQVELTRAGIPLLRNQLQQNENLLAVLVGRAPAEGGLPSFALEDFNLPSNLPLLVPSDLVRVRPDILSAEALLHAANADYGVAVSKLYPQLNLSANLGSQALTIGSLFGGGSAVWSLVSQLVQPLFNPGLSAEKRAALAEFDAAAANYQAVVLESLRNVADVLRTLENDAERLAALIAADAASRRSLDLTQRKYSLGAASYFELLIARQQAQQSQYALIDGRAKRLVNSVAFYQAMGGGFN